MKEKNRAQNPYDLITLQNFSYCIDEEREIERIERELIEFELTELARIQLTIVYTKRTSKLA